jgi:hydrogenase expression/formation protein HypC
MCIALPGRVLAIEADQAIVDLDGRIRRASLMRMPDVSVGDWALVAAGAVLRRLEPGEAAELRDLLRDVIPEPTNQAVRGGSR